MSNQTLLHLSNGKSYELTDTTFETDMINVSSFGGRRTPVKGETTGSATLYISELNTDIQQYLTGEDCTISIGKNIKYNAYVQHSDILMGLDLITFELSFRNVKIIDTPYGILVEKSNTDRTLLFI